MNLNLAPGDLVVITIAVCVTVYQIVKLFVRQK